MDQLIQKFRPRRAALARRLRPVADEGAHEAITGVVNGFVFLGWRGSDQTIDKPAEFDQKPKPDRGVVFAWAQGRRRC